MQNSNKLGQSSKCSGCTACLNVCPKQAITMQRNDKGFLYPIINKTNCVECNLCVKNCPWIIKTTENKESSIFYAAKRLDYRKRLKSQSGGAFSVIAEHTLKNKGVVYGVVFQEKNAFYIRVQNSSQLKKLKGSKYLQSSVGDVFTQVAFDLKKNRKVLFAGTACHVDGLKRYLTFRKIDISLLLTIDIICHGVVSPMIFENYVDYIENIHHKKIKWLNFRDKSFGWHGHIVTYKMGSDVFQSKDYVKIFYSSYALRETCYECQYSNLKRVSDITVGDCWGIGNHYPQFDDNKGVSLIIINSDMGKSIFEDVKSEFSFIQIEKEKAIQPNLIHPTEKPDNYQAFWNDYKKYGFEYVAYKYCDINPLNDKIVIKRHQIIKRFKAKVKRIIGL